LRNIRNRPIRPTNDSHNTLLIQLNDTIQKFHGICKVYAESISPHSKFRFKELLNHVESIAKQLQRCSNGTSNDEQKILADSEQTFRQIMQLVNR
jgi:abelson tyrosine-protein kinase 1